MADDGDVLEVQLVSAFADNVTAALDAFAGTAEALGQAPEVVDRITGLRDIFAKAVERAKEA